MSPTHPFIVTSATVFNIFNGTSIGGWLGGYGPTTAEEWSGRIIYIQIGVVIFLLGAIGNIYHDDVLREIRRASAREQQQAAAAAQDAGKSVTTEKVYKVPQEGMFRYILFPHYLCEWIEWGGFWIIGGRTCLPAQNFVIFEILEMTPRAFSGKRWYNKNFGEEKIAGRKAVIPRML